jgi:ribosomal protein L37E
MGMIKKNKELRCVACGKRISAERQNTCYYCDTPESEKGDTVFCRAECVLNYYGVGLVAVDELKAMQ